MAKGALKVQVWKGDSFVPVENTKVTIVESGETPQSTIEKTDQTDSSGLTQIVELNAPAIELSQKPSNQLPYSLVDLRVEADGFVPIAIRGCQVYPERVAYQECRLVPKSSPAASRLRQGEEIINIQPNSLVANFPPKIPEDPEKPLPPPSSGFVVLDQPVVPEFVVVHQGLPDDPSAANYTMRYKDYVKNVACCEIFSTWPDTTIRANVYAIISFTLNRIYTEWYRAKGKNFDITSSTAYDHAFSYGRNVYDNIVRVVDDIFSTYIKRAGKKQPLLTQYCDGVKVQCPGWMTQWGSKYLGDQGKTPYEILTNFYGTNIGLETAKEVAGIPKSWPGYILTQGTKGRDVRTIQTYLNRIAQNYPAIPKMAVDSIYGASTTASVKTFQKIFSLPPSGNVDYATWYRISDIYVGVTGIAELRGEDNCRNHEYCEEKLFIPPVSFNNRNNKNIPYTYYPED